MDYSEKIKNYRKTKGISQIEMAKFIGISQAAYGKIESGFTKTVTIEVGKGIALALGVSFVELFDISPDVHFEGYDSALKAHQNVIDDYEKTIKSLLLQNEQKDQLIDFFKKEIKWLKYELAVYKISHHFFHLMDDEKFVRSIQEQERIPLVEDRKKDLKELIDSYVETGYPGKKEILEILFNNMDFIDVMELISTNKDEFIKNSTLYLNNFLTISVEEMEKYVNVNINTKWDPKNSYIIKKRNAFSEYWKDTE